MPFFTRASARNSVILPSGALRALSVACLSTMLTLAPAASSLAHEFKAGSIEVDHPWSRATPEGARVAAGYLTIHNEGSTPDRLISITGDIAGRAEVHEMAVDAEGVMTMRPLSDGVEVPAGATVELKPGGFHIMFMDLKHPAKTGEPFAGTLTFEKAGTVGVEFAVEAVGAKPADDGHGG